MPEAFNKSAAATSSGASGQVPRRTLGLAHDPQQGLPRVVFKAAGELAEQALDQGLRVSGPRVVRDGALLAQLYRLPIDGAIDASLFQAVAALLAHVLALNQHLREARRGAEKLSTNLSEDEHGSGRR